MNQNLHRVFALLESLLVVLPVTLMALMGMAFMDIPAAVVDSPLQRGMLVASFSIAPICCAGCGVLIGYLALSGPHALEGRSKLLWTLTFLGAALALAGLLSMNYPTLFRGLDSHFGVFGFGAPMLLPTFHLAWVRACLKRVKCDEV